ncbi:MAG: aspartate kinase [Acidobacteriota bacterium]|nr:aspartate kinase [Acidobacteriota bacterium]
MSRDLQVMKFGGTSVGDAACIKRTADIIRGGTKDYSVVAVVSAMSGVTNRLVEAARRSASGDESAAIELAENLHRQHREAIDLIVKDDEKRAQLMAECDRLAEEAARLCRGTALLRELTPRALDYISSVGERLSSRLVAAALREGGVPGVAIEATELIVTTNDHGQAEPLMDETRERASALIKPLIAEGVVPIVTGFIGATSDGVLTTLGRGGSDYSATILGAALDASEIIIWTDVEGVMTADPRLVPEARTIREISYSEAAELAYFGAKVLHPKTLMPVADAEIPVWIRNSFTPEMPGTKITSTGNPTESGVKAITAISGVTMITVGGRGIVGVPGVAAKVFTAAASVRANVLLISQSSSQNDICFIVNSTDAERTVKSLRATFALDIAHHQIEYITVDPEIAIVAVVGERMRGTPGIAGRVFSALGRDGVNIIAIAQGSSEYNVSFVIEASVMRRAVAVVHREFHLETRGLIEHPEESALIETSR